MQAEQCSRTGETINSAHGIFADREVSPKQQKARHKGGRGLVWEGGSLQISGLGWRLHIPAPPFPNLSLSLFFLTLPG